MLTDAVHANPLYAVTRPHFAKPAWSHLPPQ